jgi:CCR4-NOT transcription complex subunit 2
LDKMEKLTDYDREFPTLSNNLSSNPSQQSTMWSTGGRNLGAPNVPNRNQANSTQPSQPDDVFNGNSRLTSASGQSSFRFGNQANQNSQAQRSSVDDFPPLNRNANGDIGQERGNNLMASNFGFGAPGAASSSSAQAGGAGNGLLNALSANSRATDARSPTTGEH